MTNKKFFKVHSNPKFSIYKFRGNNITANIIDHENVGKTHVAVYIKNKPSHETTFTYHSMRQILAYLNSYDNHS